MFEHSDLCLRLLRALTAGPVAWQTPAQLASKVGGPRAAALDALSDLDVTGWLAPWELDGELYVTLTPHAAERLGVRLVPAGRSETVRWVPLDDPEPCPRAPGRGQGDVDALDLIPDPAPGPEAEAEAAEPRRADDPPERRARRPLGVVPAEADDPPGLGPDALARPEDDRPGRLPGMRPRADRRAGLLPRLRPMGPRPPARRAGGQGVLRRGPAGRRPTPRATTPRPATTARRGTAASSPSARPWNGPGGSHAENPARIRAERYSAGVFTLSRVARSGSTGRSSSASTTRPTRLDQIHDATPS